MATTVQAPERADATVTGLQPIARPQERGVGSFLSGLIEPASQAVDKYQEDNKAHNIALGRNDQLNNVVRDVGRLNVKAYKAGRSYQSVVNGQLSLAKDFQTYMDGLDPNDFDPDEVRQRGQEFTAMSIQNIYDSDLDPKLKEQLYNSTLKENATYMTMIDKKVSKFKDDAERDTRTNELAGLTLKLRNTEQTAAETVVGLEAFIERSDTRLQQSRPELSADERRELILGDVDIAMTHLLDSIQIDGLDTDVPTMGHISAISDHLLEIGAVELSTKVQAKAQEVYTQHRANNASRAQFTYSVTRDKWLADPTLAQPESLRKIMGELTQDGGLTLEERLGLAGKYHSAYYDAQTKIVNAEVALDPMQHSPTSYNAMNKSEQDLVNDVTPLILQQFPDNPAAGGIAIMQYGMDIKGEHSPKMVRKGSEIFFRSLESYVRMSDADAKADPYAAARQDVFGQVSGLYNQYMKSSPEKARDLLSGIPAKQLDAYASVFETGGNLEDVRKRLTSIVPVEQRYTAMDTAIDDVKGLSKILNLDGEFVSSYGGRWGKSQSDGVSPIYLNLFRGALRSTKAYYSDSEQEVSTTSLVRKYENAGASIKSPAGYNAVIGTPVAGKQIAGWKSAEGVAMDVEFAGAAFDAYREQYAEKYNVQPENIVITTDKNGNAATFHILKSTGLFGKGEPERLGNEPLPLSSIHKKAQELYKESNERQQSTAGQDYLSSHTSVGMVSVQDYKTGRISTVNVTADYAKAFGNNATLGKDFLTHMQYMESFTAQRIQTKDANTGRISHVYGQGMTEATLTKFGMLDEAKAAVGKPQQMIAVQGKFTRKYYKGLDKSLSSVGVPAPTAGLYPASKKMSLMLVLDEMWHNGSIYNPKNPSRSMHAAMNAKSYSEGLSILKRLNTYNRSAKAKKEDTKRNKFMRNALKAHYKSRGLKTN